MRTFRFDKLVRDLIPADMQKEGSIVEVKTLSNTDYLAALKTKFLENPDRYPELRTEKVG